MSENKNFDLWNQDKKHIHFYIQNKFYHEREVWWCYLGVNIGFEEDGTGFNGERPVLILRGFSRQVCWIIPLSTSEKINKYYISVVDISNKKSFAIISQIRLIDTKRLINKMGFVDSQTFDVIKKTIKDLL